MLLPGFSLGLFSDSDTFLRNVGLLSEPDGVTAQIGRKHNPLSHTKYQNIPPASHTLQNVTLTADSKLYLMVSPPKKKPLVAQLLKTSQHFMERGQKPATDLILSQINPSPP
jgi:hypothetical protein